MKPKAIALVSGGLDSVLAIRVIRAQGIDLTALSFLTPFCRCANVEDCRKAITKRVASAGVPLEFISLTDEYLDLLATPTHGYGKNLNPCIDCKILMCRKASEYMKEACAQFLVTGEVLGQRPMSQRRDILNLIDRESGLKGLILRPLSAKLLDSTIPEDKGWVRRQDLFAISGRSRKEQIGLAKQFGISEYSQPAGGCLLTEEGFSQRLKDLMSYSKITLNEVELLKLGRHFRITPWFKLVVARNEAEGNRLKALAKAGDLYLEPKSIPGPAAIGRGIFDQAHIDFAARIIARYTSPGNEVEVVARILPDRQEIISPRAIDDDQLKEFMVR